MAYTNNIVCSKNNLNWIISFLFIFAITLFLFYPSLNYYFFQDDWFVLNWVRTGDLASFFQFRTDIIYWRPLSMPIFFAIAKNLFGLNPFGFHLVAFIVHSTNVVLVYVLFRTLKISSRISLLSSFFYATASFHFIPLSWLSTTSYIIGPTFILLTIILFLKDKMIAALIFFLLGFTSTELALTTIPIILILDQDIKSKFKQLIPFILIVLIYLLLRFLIFPLPASGQYQISVDQKILTNLFWYFVWIFNIPEQINTIVLLSNLKASFASSLSFAKYLILPTVLITFFAIFILISKIDFAKIVKGLGWFIFGVSPVLIVPKHIYPMYLVIGSLGIFYIFSSSLQKIKKHQKILVITVILLWFLSSFLTLSFTRNTHWIVNEQAISKAYMRYVSENINNPPSGSIFLFRPPDLDFSRENAFTLVETEDTLRQSLNNQDATQVLYDNSKLQSIYAKALDNPVLPKGKQVFEIIPKLNK